MIDLKNIKQGQVFWEQDGGTFVKYEAVGDAYQVEETCRSGWAVKGKVIYSTFSLGVGSEIVLFEAHQSYGYGPKLYSENEIYVGY